MDISSDNLTNYGVINYIEEGAETKKRRKRTKNKNTGTRSGSKKLANRLKKTRKFINDNLWSILFMFSIVYSLNSFTIEQLKWGESLFLFAIAIIQFFKVTK